MKLLKLLLQAYGPFTGKVVDFSTGPANLHLIYGPNEAGKSSALRAMLDLRFGIPVRSPDDFLHAAGDLRIGGIFATANGEPIGFVRRKGKGATLARLNVLTELPDQSLVIEPGHERGLTGGWNEPSSKPCSDSRMRVCAKAEKYSCAARGFGIGPLRSERGDERHRSVAHGIGD